MVRPTRSVGSGLDIIQTVAGLRGSMWWYASRTSGTVFCVLATDSGRACTDGRQLRIWRGRTRAVEHRAVYLRTFASRAWAVRSGACHVRGTRASGCSISPCASTLGPSAEPEPCAVGAQPTE